MNNIKNLLNQFDQAFMETPVSVDTVPDGVYEAKVVDANIFESQTGRLVLKIIFVTKEQGYEISKIYMLDAPERFRYLKEDLMLLGLLPTKLSELPDIIEQVKGKEVTLSVQTKGDYQNIYIRSSKKSIVSTPVPF